MQIIEYSSNRAKEVADVFHQAVHSIDNSIYSEEQKHAWAPLPIDYGKWKKRFEQKRPYLLLINDQVAGFIELELDGHIDCTYVSPNFQRKGVASTLLKHAIASAKKLGLKQLYVEASIIAKPFFEKFGFLVENENKLIRNNNLLINYSMHMEI
ncbi:MAG: GNAT family N-acetyltransferase [Colwellia sp.]|nr:GNAT family N-acetyltransferase [Colwellia sp.]